MKRVSVHKKEEAYLKWWQLSLIGVGCTIGTGFFLGSSIAIEKSGFSVIFTFLFAAVGTYFVFEALAKMTAEHPEKGSFRSYAKKAFGRWAGFSSGWVYWGAEMLIMGSQLTALALFSRFWFPNVPVWILASIYGFLGLIVIFLGAHGFEKTENILAVIKTAAILMFIVLAVLALFGYFDGGRPIKAQIPNSVGEFFPVGVVGLWTGLIYAFYAFGGIEVMGLMAANLTDPKEASKSGKVMLFILAVIYIVSLGLALLLVPLDAFNKQESPFVVAFKEYSLPYILDIFNGAFIIAGFSTMVASLFAVTLILVTLSEDGDAPKLFSKKGKWKVPLPALALTTSGLIVSIILALLLPKQIYEYLTTAAGLMLLYTWLFILFSYRKLSKLNVKDKIKTFSAFFLITAAVSGTLLEKTSRPGFFVSVLFAAVIGIITLMMRKRWRNQEHTS
ncbi:amino acid permease [Bacillus taeanensis]|uniref:Amino acid permease n=1 Tax=Bacillus taeanensis TaxID=273032 RepID=A0A366XS93_9BACI|nr:amino acid permease [Bacillus taeanensis]RBW69250.1 amino acid permease [Bacillus taeanensis]